MVLYTTIQSPKRLRWGGISIFCSIVASLFSVFLIFFGGAHFLTLVCHVFEMRPGKQGSLLVLKDAVIQKRIKKTKMNITSREHTSLKHDKKK